MSLLEGMLSEIKLNFFEWASEGHGFFINSILQLVFFTMAIIHIITWILKKCNFFFANDFSKSNGIIGTSIFFLLIYIKLWDKYTPHLEILGYFCSVSICIHLYESCLRWGVWLCHKDKNFFGNISSLIAILLVYLSYKVFTLSQM